MRALHYAAYFDVPQLIQVVLQASQPGGEKRAAARDERAKVARATFLFNYCRIKASAISFFYDKLKYTELAFLSYSAVQYNLVVVELDLTEADHIWSHRCVFYLKKNCSVVAK